MNATKLRIHTWPDKILRKRCRKVKEVDSKIRVLFDQMLALMREYKGIGLAANQAGGALSLVIVEAEDRIFKLVNPVIVKKSGKCKIKEGCLSFPGLEMEIPRAKKVLVRALNEHGQPLEIEAQNIIAVIFQHEIDHVNGITFIERASFLQKMRFAPLLSRIKKGTKHAMSQREEK